jgi:hypothetical protein
MDLHVRVDVAVVIYDHRLFDNPTDTRLLLTYAIGLLLTTRRDFDFLTFITDIFVVLCHFSCQCLPSFFLQS